MIRYILRRLLYGFYVLLGVITVVFLLFNVLPGDPARMMLGQRADIASVEAINRDLGLDKPLTLQYLNFLNDLSPVIMGAVLFISIILVFINIFVDIIYGYLDPRIKYS